MINLEGISSVILVFCPVLFIIVPTLLCYGIIKTIRRLKDEYNKRRGN